MIFLLGCITVLLMVPARVFCLTDVEDILAIVSMFCHGFYFLFFCRGIKLVGPMVTMIYRMMMQDLARFGTVFFIFVMGFSQAFFIIFLSFVGDVGCDPDNDEECFVSVEFNAFASNLSNLLILNSARLTIRCQTSWRAS